ncbi:polyphosphate polymerase domain-containing protein [bacterium]|nr:polyphosphate polymerase domain-containing protein [bacterium]
MGDYVRTFERREVKYLLTDDQLRTMRDAVAGWMEPDEYGRSVITSTYYDTPRHEVALRSLDKPAYREKLRVRTYGATPDDGRAFVELKVKYDDVVYKRRLACSRVAASEYLGGVPYERACALHPLPDPAQAAASVDGHSRQVAREIDAMRDRYGGRLRPSVAIEARRIALRRRDGARRQTAPEEDVRITFDDVIRATDLQDASRGRAVDLLERGTCLMEIKVVHAMPLWLVDALGACGAYPSSFSKYGVAYERLYGRDRDAGLRVARRLAPAGAPSAVRGWRATAS